MMPPERRSAQDYGSPVTPQLLVGLVVIAIGVLLTLDNLGLVDARHYLRFWPLALIAVGLLKLWQARGGPGAFCGLLFALAGTWLLLERAAIVTIRFRDVWPLLLVCFGGLLVWKGLSRPRRQLAFDAGLPGRASESRAVITAMAVLGSVVRGSNAPALRGGELTAVMGGCELDLRQASIDGEAVFDVFALWGGIEIRVPEDWTVESRITPVLGGVEDKTRPALAAGRHRLVLRGLVIMAGVEIKN